MRPTETLSRRQRRLTPLPFARALAGLVHCWKWRANDELR
jgi:hypothetical protein